MSDKEGTSTTLTKGLLSPGKESVRKVTVGLIGDKVNITDIDKTEGLLMDYYSVILIWSGTNYTLIKHIEERRPTD